MRNMWSVALLMSLTYINFVTSEDCPRLEKVGCFKDTKADRVLPNELINRKKKNSPHWDGQPIEWAAYESSIRSLACACAKAAKAKGWKYFGLQDYGECWSGSSSNPARDGPSQNCIDTNFNSCDDGAKLQCVGTQVTNYVYKLAPENSPINGRWASWTSWSVCSKSCDKGIRTRKRTCTNPKPQPGGKLCSGKATDEKGCNLEPCERKCEAQMDIGIILDGSNTVKESGWARTIEFVKRLSSAFRIGPHHTKFGIIQFSWHPTMYFGFSNKTCWTSKGFEEEVSRISYKYGETFPDRALKMAAEEMMCAKCGTRPTAGKALLIVTDGKANPKSTPMDEASEGLKSEGVTIVAIGVGDVNYNALRQLATDSKHVITLTGGYTYIDDPINKVVKLLCNRDYTYSPPIDGGWTTWTSWSACSKSCNSGKRTRTRTCTNPPPSHGGQHCAGKAAEAVGCNQEPCEKKCEAQMDIGIIVDCSNSVGERNWYKTINFVKHLSKVFKIGPHHVKFGIIRFSWQAEMQFTFSDKECWTSEGFENKVSRIDFKWGGTRTDRALKMAEEELMCANCGTRPTAGKALLVITDGNPSPKSAPMDKATRGLKRAGVKIVAVGVGDQDYDTLRKIATDSNHVITLNGYSYIDDPINKLVRLLCNRGKTANDAVVNQLTDEMMDEYPFYSEETSDI